MEHDLCQRCAASQEMPDQDVFTIPIGLDREIEARLSGELPVMRATASLPLGHSLSRWSS